MSTKLFGPNFIYSGELKNFYERPFSITDHLRISTQIQVDIKDDPLMSSLHYLEEDVKIIPMEPFYEYHSFYYLAALILFALSAITVTNFTAGLDFNCVVLPFNYREYLLKALILNMVKSEDSFHQTLSLRTKVGEDVTTSSRDCDDQVVKRKEFSCQEDFVISPATDFRLHWDQLKES